MKIQKRHIVLSALIVALAAAVYLNWHFTDTGSLVSPASKELGAATYVSAEAKSTVDEAESERSSSSEEARYFAEAMTNRTQAQDKALSEAKNVLKLSDSSDEMREEALSQMNQIENRIIAQADIENILRAKGFSSCLCYLSDEGCTVTVLSSDMSDSSPLVIKDAVTSHSDVSFNDITIVEI